MVLIKCILTREKVMGSATIFYNPEIIGPEEY